MMSYFSPDGQTFVTITDGIDKFSVSNSLRVWDTTTATLRHADLKTTSVYAHARPNDSSSRYLRRS